MQYTLKNKDKDALSFDFEQIDKRGKFSNINIIDEKILPITINADTVNTDLKSWIAARKIPKGRQLAQNILKKIGKEDTILRYIDVSLGLSLNDTYWVVPANKNYQWKDVNLYHNDFDEALQMAAFGHNIPYKGKRSPELTTNGMLKKCWNKEKDGIYLYKGSTITEAFAEYYNYQIAKALELDAVPYDIIEFDNEIVSRCPLFTNENEGYAPIEFFIHKEIGDTDDVYREDCADFYGQEAFEDLMVYDALIGNIDRHSYNFGMIVDNNTNKILRPAPIFDNGNGLLGCYLKGSSVNKSYKTQYERGASAFNLFFDEQLNMYLKDRHIPKLEKLLDFSFERHPKYNLDEKNLVEFEDLLHEKVRLALNSYSPPAPEM